MPYARIVASIATAFAATGACAADKLSITVTHSLAQARPAETITIPWPEVNRGKAKASPTAS